MQRFQQKNATKVTRIGELEQALTDASGFEEFHSSPTSERLMERILTRSHRADVVSFDIFDTVLWRDRRSELERFSDVAHRFMTIAPQLEHRACLTARIQAASHAYQLSELVENTTEGRLRDIALNMMRILRMPGDMHQLAEAWCRTELAVEKEQLRLAPFIDDLILRLTEMKKKIIFVSDMYLQADQICELLEACGFDCSRAHRIISTADTRVNKRSGTIFPRISLEMQIEPERFLHIGDSLTSDFKMPLRSGWRAIHLPVPKAVLANRRESHFATCAAVFGRRQMALPMSVPPVGVE